MRHEDVAVTFSTGRERPHMVLEIKPLKTKRYRGKKKLNSTLGIPEIPILQDSYTHYKYSRCGFASTSASGARRKALRYLSWGPEFVVKAAR
ncbi:hypothetical protein EYZ11_008390 [Aspergillus tanneri]|uniref:Uncharacterized protein n=1 Tax=Aspergillus tanneri TaxID=1220188 RepID=A0A4S3JB04_9EURO|nr:hypothetical protein EYZ11_008390 [Aspergillus tanneri]